MSARYYSTQRPVGIGGYPKSAPVKQVVNFNGRKHCPEIGRLAWGYIEYETPIPEKDAEDYELVRMEGGNDE